MKLRENFEIKIDWLSIMFKSIRAEDIMTTLKISSSLFREVRKGIKHKEFTSAYELGEMIIFGNTQPCEKNPNGLGAYLVLSGKGCTQLNEYLKEQERTIEQFISDCIKLDNSLVVTRLDIAIDDLNPIPCFTIDMLNEKCIKGEFRSKSRSFEYIASATGSPDRAKTLYIGKRKSTIFYRFYEKDKEISRKQHIPLEQIPSRKRTELQLRTTKATIFAKRLLNSKMTLESLHLIYYQVLCCS